MFKWLETARLVRKVVQRMRREEMSADAGSDEQHIVISNISAVNVPDADFKKGAGCSDPYIVFKAFQNDAVISEVETKSREDQTNPVFEGEVLTMLLPAGLVPQLKVELYDCDWGKDDDLLGSVKHSCSAGGESISLDLKPDQHLDISTLRGQMGCTFSYRFVPGPPPTPPATRLEISA